VGSEIDLPTPQERDLRNWRLVERFKVRLRAKRRSVQLHPSFADPGRLLQVDDYLSLCLFGLFNSTVRTTRGLCRISRLKRVQAEVCGRGVSLGSFSEAQHLVTPQLLEEVFSDLARELPAPAGEGRLGQWQWLARDGSLFRALPRMEWALYGGGRAGAPNRAVRLHLSLNLLEDKPQVAAVRPGKVCERAVWRQQWQPGQAYVGDRYFAEDYRAFGELNLLGCVYVLRLREPATITIEEEIPLSEADRQAGVFQQAWVHLGSKRNRSVRVRLVWVNTREGNPLILITNLTPEQLPAESVWLLYKKRWQIELFFRWIKCVLGCGHWLAESPAGVTLQIYLALIAALLLQLFTGQKPNRRLMELLQLHQQGWATDEELLAGFKLEQERILKGKKRN
jgi:hypothetical protein